MGDLAIGVGPGIGPEGTTARRIKTGRRLEQADHGELVEILVGVTGAAGTLSTSAGSEARLALWQQRQIHWCRWCSSTIGVTGGMSTIWCTPGRLSLTCPCEARSAAVAVVGDMVEALIAALRWQQITAMARMPLLAAPLTALAIAFAATETTAARSALSGSFAGGWFGGIPGAAARSLCYTSSAKRAARAAI
jgi:hypothetical protein